LNECFFQKLKRNRRISMRFEKLEAHFLAMVTLAAALLLARVVAMLTKLCR
jgi:transposase